MTAAAGRAGRPIEPAGAGSAISGRTGRAARYLAALRAELSVRGMKSETVTLGERPRLHLYYEDAASGFGDAEFDDNVIAAPDAAGRWWYWWPWIEQISPANDALGAAHVIVPRDECMLGEPADD